MVLIGDSCIDRSDNFGPGTYIIPNNSIPIDGKISSWCIYSHAPSSSAKLKVFRIVGSTMVFVGETPITAIIYGLNSGLSANINVQTGDLLGVYLSSNQGGAGDTSDPHNYYTKYNVDVTTDQLISYYTGYYSAGPFSFQAQTAKPASNIIGRSSFSSRGASVSGGISAGKGKKRG